MNRAVFLDRDGALNLLVPLADGSLASPSSLGEFQLVTGAARQVERLHRASFLDIVATNQPDLARGFLPAPLLEAMHDVWPQKSG